MRLPRCRHPHLLAKRSVRVHGLGGKQLRTRPQFYPPVHQQRRRHPHSRGLPVLLLLSLLLWPVVRLLSRLEHRSTAVR